MSVLSRFGSMAIRINQRRGMAAAAGATDPIQRLFIDKIHEFKDSRRGLDEQYKNKEAEELARLKKVFSIENESALAQVDAKFPKSASVSLGDLDEIKDRIKAVASGEYTKQKELELQAKLAANQITKVEQRHDSPYHPKYIGRVPAPSLAEASHKVPIAVERGADILEYERTKDSLSPDYLEKVINVRFGKDMPTVDDDKSPERDLVNYPRYQQLMDLPPRVFHVLPKSWFDFFHSKTGITGGYTFATTFGAFLVSKEWIVMDHELASGLSCTIIFTVGVIKAGPTLRTYCTKIITDCIEGWKKWQQDTIVFLDNVASHYRDEATKVDKIPLVYDARRKDIQVQLEAEYRQRLKAVHDSTKRKLNYLVAVADSKRNIAHEFMVNWVIDSAVKSIGAKQETEVLDNCIISLKNLSQQNANAI